MKCLMVAGARPNFIKIKALYQAFALYPEIQTRFIHTGQHFSPAMSEDLLNQLELPRPDIHLGIHAGTPAQQCAQIVLRLGRILELEKPGLVLVVGDTTSTLAGALAAKQAGIPLAHVEAGLRSGDQSMPEEVNRIITDALSEYLFVTEPAGVDNLLWEGIEPEKVFFVGNCMIDTLLHFREKAAQGDTLKRLGLLPRQYVLLTMHRPSNVDHLAGLQKILKLLELALQHTRIVFPLHPRTRANFEKFGLFGYLQNLDGLILTGPQGYLEFLQLMDNASTVLTDSGGVQEETTFLQIPCLTFRKSTERPVTVELGTNELLDELDPELAVERLQVALSGGWKKGEIPPLWDGNAGERIVGELMGQVARKTSPLPPSGGG